MSSDRGIAQQGIAGGRRQRFEPGRGIGVPPARGRFEAIAVGCAGVNDPGAHGGWERSPGWNVDSPAVADLIGP